MKNAKGTDFFISNYVASRGLLLRIKIKVLHFWYFEFLRKLNLGETRSQQLV